MYWTCGDGATISDTSVYISHSYRLIMFQVYSERVVTGLHLSLTASCRFLNLVKSSGPAALQIQVNMYFCFHIRFIFHHYD